MAIDRRALVLNQNYEPLNVCAVRRAFVLVYHGKAEVIQTAADAIRSAGGEFPLPSVIRLHQPVKRPRPRVRLTRKEVFARDGHRCQYCGAAGTELTIDHVMPRHRGGPHEWENLVAACRPCNHRKGGRTPSEARMHLLQQPRRPAATPAALFGQYLERYREWHPFLLGWIERGTRSAVAAS